MWPRVCGGFHAEVDPPECTQHLACRRRRAAALTPESHLEYRAVGLKTRTSLIFARRREGSTTLTTYTYTASRLV